MDVSIIIVNYNTCAITKQCIDSIFKETKDVNFEIILVDNASTDNSYEIFSKDKRIKFILSKINLGFGKANNLGYKEAKGKYIFLLNSDTILLNNAVKIFRDEFEKMPRNVACLGTILKASDGISDNNSYSEFPSLKTTIQFLKGLYFRQKNNSIKKQNTPFEVDYIIGADLFIRRSVIEKLGLFDPDFFMYYEETEMQYRYHNMGYKSIIINQPHIIHLEGASTNIRSKKLTGKKAVMYYYSMLIYMGKRYSGLKYLFFRLLFFLFVPLMIYNRVPLKVLTLTLKPHSQIIKDKII